MGWKIGAKAYVCQDDPEDKLCGLPSKIGRKVTVMATDCGGYSNIKVMDAEGSIFYVRSSWIKPLNKAKTNKETKEIKKAATEMAEQRMKEIMEKQEEKALTLDKLEIDPIIYAPMLPTFESVREQFYALARFANQTPENPANDIVLHLAERGLFETIKNGCIWEEPK